MCRHTPARWPYATPYLLIAKDAQNLPVRTRIPRLAYKDRMIVVVATVLGICAPALLLGAAVRRWVSPVSWTVIAAMLALVTVFLARGDWHGFGNYSMVAPTFLGLLPLLLFLMAAAMSRHRRVWWFALFAILCFLAAMNWSPLGHAINALPVFSTTANDRLRVLTVFFAALAIGAGVARVTALRVPVMRLILVACCLELFLLNIPFNALARIRYYKPDLPILRRLQAAVRQHPGRVAGFDWTFLPSPSIPPGPCSNNCAASPTFASAYSPTESHTPSPTRPARPYTSPPPRKVPPRTPSTSTQRSPHSSPPA